MSSTFHLSWPKKDARISLEQRKSPRWLLSTSKSWRGQTRRRLKQRRNEFDDLQNGLLKKFERSGNSRNGYGTYFEDYLLISRSSNREEQQCSLNSNDCAANSI